MYNGGMAHALPPTGDGRMASRDRRPLLGPVKADLLNERILSIFRGLVHRLLPACFVPACVAFAGVTYFSLVVAPRLFVTSDPSNLQVQAMEVALALGVGVLVAAPLMLGGLAASTYYAVRDVAKVITGTEVPTAPGMTFARFLLTYLRPLLLALWPPIGAVASFFVANAFVGQDDALSSTLFFLGIMGGTVLAIWGMFSILQLFGARLILAPIMLLEGKSGKAAVDRCRYLMASTLAHPAPTFSVSLMLIFSGLVALLLSVALGSVFAMIYEMTLPPAMTEGPVGVLVGRFLAVLPTLFCFWAVMPLWGTAATVVYFDRICRLEAYDIRLMAKELCEGGRRTRLLR